MTRLILAYSLIFGGGFVLGFFALVLFLWMMKS